MHIWCPLYILNALLAVLARDSKGVHCREITFSPMQSLHSIYYGSLWVFLGCQFITQQVMCEALLYRDDTMTVRKRIQLSVSL
jgi:hypothetical protein